MARVELVYNSLFRIGREEHLSRDDLLSLTTLTLNYHCFTGEHTEQDKKARVTTVLLLSLFIIIHATTCLHNRRTFDHSFMHVTRGSVEGWNKADE